MAGLVEPCSAKRARARSLKRLGEPGTGLRDHLGEVPFQPREHDARLFGQQTGQLRRFRGETVSLRWATLNSLERETPDPMCPPIRLSLRRLPRRRG
jgi:hypothetical protein